jgi:hypothetical protein
MKRRRRKRTIDIPSEVRRRARDVVGLPPTEKVIADKRRKAPKHKKKLLEEFE